MPDFDPELHLRRIAERELVLIDDRRSRRWGTDLVDVATALVSCGVISAGRAAPLLSAYHNAFELRSTFSYRSRAQLLVEAAAAPEQLAPRHGSGKEFQIQAQTPENPAISWLWQTLADFSDTTGRPTGLPAMITALQAAGLIPASHPELDALAWVRARALPVEKRESADGPPPPAVPQEWRRFRTGRIGSFSGPTLELTIGAVTPIFGGVCLAVDGLSSDPFAFSLHAEASGATLADGSSTVLARNPLACWARDDNANVYLGHAESWSGSADGGGRSHGTIEFAALDPTASHVTIIAQTVGARASLRIGLA